MRRRSAVPARVSLALAGCLALLACGGNEPGVSATASAPATGGRTPLASATSATASATPAASRSPATTGSFPASASIAPSLSASPSPSSAPSLDPALGVTWQLADGSVFSSADVVSDAAALGGVVVAVGATDGEASSSAAAWYSLDGYRWARADALPGADSATIESVAVGPAGLVAVGFDDSGEAVRPAAWRSVDGRSWTRSDDADLERGQMSAVAGGADGYVALGIDFDEGSSLLWSSADGSSWTPATLVPGVDADAVINGLATIGQGFIAYGSSPREQAQMWYSLDGRSWRPVPGFAGDRNTTVNDVALSDDRFVAAGAHYVGDTARALVWTSADGLSWQREAVELDGEMIGVEPVGGGFYAVGAVPEANELRFAAGVWSSADGAAWQRRPDSPTFELARMIELFRAGPGLVAIGERSLDAAGEEVQPAVWVGLPE